MALHRCPVPTHPMLRSSSFRMAAPKTALTSRRRASAKTRVPHAAKRAAVQQRCPVPTHPMLRYTISRGGGKLQAKAAPTSRPGASVRKRGLSAAKRAATAPAPALGRVADATSHAQRHVVQCRASSAMVTVTARRSPRPADLTVQPAPMRRQTVPTHPILRLSSFRMVSPKTAPKSRRGAIAMPFLIKSN
jgi:hypothetical protein